MPIIREINNDYGKQNSDDAYEESLKDSAPPEPKGEWRIHEVNLEQDFSATNGKEFIFSDSRETLELICCHLNGGCPRIVELTAVGMGYQQEIDFLKADLKYWKQEYYKLNQLITKQ